MWQDLFTAIALLLVLEGVMPFLNPQGLKRTLYMMVEMKDSSLRFLGLMSMVVGVIILSFIR